MPAGQIIFLNGTSSAGKTTLARTLQECLPAPYLHMSLDQFRDGLPDKFRGLNAPPGTPGFDGLNVVPVTGVQKPFTAVRFGETGKQVLQGMRRAMAAVVAVGNNIIVDDVLLEPAFLDDYLAVFEPFNVLFVGVRCDRAIINERERSRPGRFPGTAVGHFEACHAHGVYDLEVDSGRCTPDGCARLIQQALSQQSFSTFPALRLARLA